MKPYKKTFVCILAMVMVAFIGSMATAADEQTLTGEINGDGQLVADDGKIYELGESDKSAELYDMSGKKVTVTGTVLESEGTMTIDVMEYKVIE